jgi:hypothetical protein
MMTIGNLMNSNPFASLYAAQAMIYWAAAAISHSEGHSSLMKCYAGSGIMCWLMCLNHLAR